MDQEKLIKMTIVSQIAAQLANADAKRNGVQGIIADQIIDKSIELYEKLNERI